MPASLDDFCAGWTTEVDMKVWLQQAQARAGR